MSKESQVKAKYGNACCVRCGKGFQIWDMLFSWAGDKLGEGRTEKEAWANAAKQLNQYK